MTENKPETTNPSAAESKPDTQTAAAPETTATAEPKAEAPAGKTEFEAAGQEESMSLVQEFGLFIKENKAWWMVPIIVVLGLVGAMALLTNTAAAPFIYTIF